MKIFVKSTGNLITFSVDNVLKYSYANLVEIFCWNGLVVISTASFTERILTDNENNITVFQQKYFVTEILTENKVNLMVIWQYSYLLTHNWQKMLNIYGHYTRDILLNGNVRISQKIIEIRAIYLDT